MDICFYFGINDFIYRFAIRDEFDNVFMDYRDESQKTADLKKPFKLEENQQIGDTPVHKAIREAFVNLIIHSDYLLDAVTLKIIKTADSFEFTNPGILKLPIDEIFKGGNSKPRNPHMQTMLRMVGFGDNAGSGFPTILHVWNVEGWVKPELNEDTRLNQVTLTLKMVESAEKSAKKSADSSKNLEKRFEQILNEVVSMNKIITSGTTKGRRYIKK